MRPQWGQNSVNVLNIKIYRLKTETGRDRVILDMLREGRSVQLHIHCNTTSFYNPAHLYSSAPLAMHMQLVLHFVRQKVPIFR